jgi:predicted transcriptional regulator
MLGIGMKIIFFPVNTVERMIDTAYDAQSKVINADNAIYNYEWFKQKYQDIEAGKKQLVNAQISYSGFLNSLPKDRIDWGFEDKTEQARLNTVVLGLQNNLESMIADYNARASMATRNIFEDSVLPSFIDSLTFITK